MKKIILTVLIAFSSIGLFAQPVPPPTTGGGHGLSGDQNGAPLDGGLSILLLLSAAYGGKKAYRMRKSEE